MTDSNEDRAAELDQETRDRALTRVGERLRREQIAQAIKAKAEEVRAVSPDIFSEYDYATHVPWYIGNGVAQHVPQGVYKDAPFLKSEVSEAEVEANRPSRTKKPGVYVKDDLVTIYPGSKAFAGKTVLVVSAPPGSPSILVRTFEESDKCASAWVLRTMVKEHAPEGPAITPNTLTDVGIEKTVTMPKPTSKKEERVEPAVGDTVRYKKDNYDYFVGVVTSVFEDGTCIVLSHQGRNEQFPLRRLWRETYMEKKTIHVTELDERQAAYFKRFGTLPGVEVDTTPKTTETASSKKSESTPQFIYDFAKGDLITFQYEPLGTKRTAKVIEVRQEKEGTLLELVCATHAERVVIRAEVATLVEKAFLTGSPNVAEGRGATVWPEGCPGVIVSGFDEKSPLHGYVSFLDGTARRVRIQDISSLDEKRLLLPGSVAVLRTAGKTEYREEEVLVRHATDAYARQFLVWFSDDTGNVRTKTVYQDALTLKTPPLSAKNVTIGDRISHWASGTGATVVAISGTTGGVRVKSDDGSVPYWAPLYHYVKVETPKGDTSVANPRPEGAVFDQEEEEIAVSDAEVAEMAVLAGLSQKLADGLRQDAGTRMTEAAKQFNESMAEFGRKTQMASQSLMGALSSMAQPGTPEEKKDEKGMIAQAFDVVLDDAGNAAMRRASKTLMRMVRDMVASFVAARAVSDEEEDDDRAERRSGSIRTTVVKLLKTEEGEAFVKYVLAMGWHLMVRKFVTNEKLLFVGDQIAKELRVQAMEPVMDFGMGFVEKHVLPFLSEQAAKAGILVFEGGKTRIDASVLDAPAENANVRVVTMPALEVEEMKAELMRLRVANMASSLNAAEPAQVAKKG